MLFLYQSERFDEARKELMLPFPDDESKALARALWNCRLALDELPDRRLLANEPKVLRWIQTVEEAMDTRGREDSGNEGALYVKARNLSFDEQEAFSTAVRELADWFGREAVSSSL